MTPEEIANHAAVMIAAMRDEADSKYKCDVYVWRLMLDPEIVAATVAAYLAGIERGAK